MNLYSELKHSNGLKIYCASKIVGKSIQILEERGVRFGARLQLDCKPPVNLCPNSSVLYLFESVKSSSQEQHNWIQWEATSLQVHLIPYLKCLAEKKVDKSLEEKLKITLEPLNSHLSNISTKYMFQDVSAIDVILFGSLIPLFLEDKANEFLKKNLLSLHKYLENLLKEEIFKNSVNVWYGEKGFSLKPWVNHLSSHLPDSNTLSLLKVDSSIIQSKQENVEECKIPEEDIIEAEKSWKEGYDLYLKNLVNSEVKHPVLPKANSKNILITSALPYVNNVPHLGNIIGCVLSGDVFARFCRLRGDTVLYISGTDEYGTATETKAIAEGLTPKQICDKYHEIHSSVYKWFDISFDYFGRTTTNSQTEITQSIFWDLEKNNMISKKSVDQLFCSSCERFLADRFVEGNCPHPGCTFEDARGDQCDGCGKLVNAIELINPRCKLCSKSPVVKSSKHLFLDLPQVEEQLQTWIKANSSKWSSNAKIICESWIRDGLKERCITRDLKWGTPVPLEGYKEKVFYVWFDAPIGYLSITKEYTDQWKDWWQNPESIQYYEFMAKDNVPFHSVVFPATQLASKRNWTMVTHLIATEYLNYEEGKFSKSRGIGVFGDQAQTTNIDSDIWRFYLLYVRPENHDTSFSWSDLQIKNNSELLNNLGNFINRSLKLTYQFFGGVIPSVNPNRSDYTIMASINHEYECYLTCLELCKIRDALRHVLSISRIGNQYIQENEPYKLIKPGQTEENKLRAGTIIAISVNIVALLAIIIEPFMPAISKKTKGYLNSPNPLNTFPVLFTCLIQPGNKINEPSPLIRKITDEEIAVLKGKFAGEPNPNPPSNLPKEKESNSTSSKVDLVEAERLKEQITEQGNKVREMKSNKAAPADIKIEVEKLLELKKALAKAEGVEFVEASKGKKKKK